MKRFIIYAIASSGGLGYSPWVPGTVGSLGGVLLFSLFSYIHLSLAAIVVIILGLFFAGVWASSLIEKEVAKKDPGFIVIDEVVGMLITYSALPFNIQNLVAGFILFRILDIVKPFPARSCEALKGGIGVMLDDVVSGLYSLSLLWLLSY